MKRLFARWRIKDLPTNKLDFHIKCGRFDEHFEQFSPTCKGAVLTYHQDDNGVDVQLSVPSVGVHHHEGFWMQPNTVNGEGAYTFGII